MFFVIHVKQTYTQKKQATFQGYKDRMGLDTRSSRDGRREGSSESKLRKRSISHHPPIRLPITSAWTSDCCKAGRR